MSYRLIGAAFSDPGAVRQKNEDNFNLFGNIRTGSGKYSCTAEISDGRISLAAVCDGIGGEAAGEVASEMAAKGLCVLPQKAGREGIDRILKDINLKIAASAKEMGNKMGCTFAGVYFENDRAFICNVGDSKVFLLRDGSIRQMSLDHTAVAQQIKMGLISSEKDAPENIKHTLTQNIGTDPEEFGIEPYHAEEIQLKKKDVFLICSDGLSDVVDDDEKEIILSKWRGFCFTTQSSFDALEKTAEELIDTALKAGSKDNITVVIVKVV